MDVMSADLASVRFVVAELIITTLGDSWLG